MANLQLSYPETFLVRGLTDLLLSFSDARCSDERDILYDLNSLSMGSLLIRYQRPVEDVYMDFVYNEVTRETLNLVERYWCSPFTIGFVALLDN
jgi:hypothetical protein